MRSMEEKRLKREKLEEKERRRNDREMRRELKEKAMAEKMKGEYYTVKSLTNILYLKSRNFFFKTEFAGL